LESLDSPPNKETTPEFTKEANTNGEKECRNIVLKNNKMLKK
jgi:hypothetical protein